MTVIVPEGAVSVNSSWKQVWKVSPSITDAAWTSGTAITEKEKFNFLGRLSCRGVQLHKEVLFNCCKDTYFSPIKRH